MTAADRARVLDYEYRVVSLPRDSSPDAARGLLTEFAEYGRWELERHRIMADGSRRVRLRRRIIRIAHGSGPRSDR